MPFPALHMIEAAVDAVEAHLTVVLNNHIRQVWDSHADVPGTGKINLPIIAPNAFYKTEALEPKALPACFIIGDSSEHDLNAQNFALQNHTVFVAILSEDKENDQLQRKTWRYAEALYRALHDAPLQGNMRCLIEGVSYSPTYGNSGDRENRQFRKDCTVRLKVKHFDRFP